MKLKKIEISLIITLLSVFIAIFVLSLIFPSGFIHGGDYEYLITIILSFVLLFWGINMIYRVQYKRQRIYIIILVLSFFFWILLRFIKWLPNIHYVSIYADYFYYVPMTLIPIIFFMMTIDTFYPQFKKKKTIYAVLVAVAIVLIVLVLTNQLHFLFYKDYHFSHGDNPNIEIITSSYGPFHYVALGYVAIVSLGAFIAFAIGSRKQLSISQTIVVSSAFLLTVTYIALYTFGLFSTIPLLRDFATCTTTLLTILLESLLSIGLIQNNGRYISNFSKANIGIGIYDESDRLIYATTTFNLEKDNIKVINKNIGAYKSKTIEDLNAINNLQKEVEKEVREIEEANKHLKTLIEINKQEASLKYRLSLIDEIENNINSAREEIISITKELPDTLNKEAKDKLSYIAMLLGYMKQKCMLLIRAKEELYMTKEQVSFLMHVISEDIKSAGYDDVIVNIMGNDDFSIRFLTSVNDYIHEVAKAYAFNNAQLLIVLENDKKTCKVRIFGENVKLKEINYKHGDVTSAKDEDSIIHILEALHE